MRTRRYTFTLLLSFCLLFIAAWPAHGQTPPLPAPAGWDPGDPTNVIERADFVDRWVNGIDSGDMRQAMGCFKFTHDLPSYAPYIFHKEFVMFADIYSARLTPDYGFYELMRDDVKVRHSFRDFIVTGKLTTSLTDNDADAVLKHMYAILDALFDGAKYDSIEGYTFVNGELVSQDLKLKPPPPQQLPPVPPTVPGGQNTCLDWWIQECLPDRTLIGCLLSHHLYWSSDDPVWPDFDCDDFGWMTMNWLRRTLLRLYPNADVFLANICWTCQDGTQECHIFIKIVVDGVVYYYEPQSGELRGPYPAGITPDEELSILKQLLNGIAHCANPDHFERPPGLPNKPWQWLPPQIPDSPPFDFHHDDLGQLNDPCHTDDPAYWSWLRFKEKLAACCQNALHHTPQPPDQLDCPDMLGPPEHPLAWWPDLCDPGGYTWPWLYPVRNP